MNILFIHGNYPAQFRHLAEALGEQKDHDVRFLTCRKDHELHSIRGVRVITFDDIDGSICSPHPLVNTTDQGIRRGERIQSILLELAQQGFVPKLVFVHSGNGLGSLVKELIPDCILIGYFEWYFSAGCAEVLLGKTDLTTRNMVSMRNLMSEHELVHCNTAVIPTDWQASTFPDVIRSKLQVVFDGIDIAFFQPPKDELCKMPQIFEGESGTVRIEPNELLLSYATRGMEPIRGFPEFMRAIPRVLRDMPNVKILIGGRDRSAYGAAAPSHGGSWKKLLLDELGAFEGSDRVTFTGLMNYGNYRLMLQRTNLHCYFTKPYVTSWSLFEAAACGTPILTNVGPATTGVLPIPDGRALPWEDLFSEKLAESIVKLLREKPIRKSYLPQMFERINCRNQWQNVINNALQT